MEDIKKELIEKLKGEQASVDYPEGMAYNAGLNIAIKIIEESTLPHYEVRKEYRWPLGKEFTLTYDGEERILIIND